jgi:hypothetical protein
MKYLGYDNRYNEFKFFNGKYYFWIWKDLLNYDSGWDGTFYVENEHGYEMAITEQEINNNLKIIREEYPELCI